MLTYYHNGNEYPVELTDYYVRELASGFDEVIFEIPIRDPIYKMLQEEEAIVDRAGQHYTVKKIDGGSELAKVICQLDLDAWRAQMLIGFNSGSVAVGTLIDQVAPDGWTVLDRSYISTRRTLQGNYTPLEVCEAARDIYQVYIRWDTVAKTCTIYPKALADPVGSFATRELNLKEINYKGKSEGLVTRLYPYGQKNDAGVALTIEGAEIGGEIWPYPYVENHEYSDKVICAYWSDERYTDVESLYHDAVEKLKVMAMPVRSYDCSIIDLQATNPELYGNLDFSLFTSAVLIDDVKNTAVTYQVVERHVYPYMPDRNEVILSSAPAKITSEITRIVDTVENPNSGFRQIMDIAVDNATRWLLSGNGYIVAVKGDDGSWSELLFMDTPDMATASDVLRINKNGIGFSRTGVNGPYTNAWTIDGNLVADFITTGTMSADRVRTGTLQSINGKVVINLDDDSLSIDSPYFKLTQDGGIYSYNPNNTSQYVKLNDGTLAFFSGSTLRGQFGRRINGELNLQFMTSDGSAVGGWFNDDSLETANGFFLSDVGIMNNGSWISVKGKILALDSLTTTVQNQATAISNLQTAYNNLQALVYQLHGLS